MIDAAGPSRVEYDDVYFRRAAVARRDYARIVRRSRLYGSAAVHGTALADATNTIRLVAVFNTKETRRFLASAKMLLISRGYERY